MIYAARHRVHIFISNFYFKYAEYWVVKVDHIFNYSVSLYDNEYLLYLQHKSAIFTINFEFQNVYQDICNTITKKHHAQGYSKLYFLTSGSHFLPLSVINVRTLFSYSMVADFSLSEY